MTNGEAHQRADQISQDTAFAARREWISGLDGTRALAVLAVLIFHISPSHAPGGFAGVDVFFVISGFLITTLLLGERAETGRFDLRGFYTRRVRRLMPAVVVVVAFVGAAAIFIGGELLQDLPPSIIGIITFTQNWVMLLRNTDYFEQSTTGLFDNFWSLAIEEQFYLLWPVLLLLLLPRRRGVVLCTLTIATVAGAAAPLVLSSVGLREVAYLSTFGHAFGLLLGGLLAASLQVVGTQDVAIRTPVRMRSLAASTLTIAGLIAFAILVFSPFGEFRENQTAITLAGAGAGGLVVTGSVMTPSPISRALDAGPLRWLGRRSYGIYLWHLPLIVLADAFVPPVPEWGRTPWRVLAVALAVGAAALSFRFVEQPIRLRGLRAIWSTSSGGVFLVTPGVVVIVVMLAAGWSSPSSPLSVSESDSRCSTTPAPNAGVVPSVPAHLSTAELVEGPVVAIGDSVMLASEHALKRVFPDIVVDAAVSRQLADSADLVSTHLAERPDTGMVIIGLGINGIGGEADLRAVVEAAGNRVVVLVNTSGPVAWESRVNADISAIAADFDNVLLADWKTQALSRPDLIASDGVHPDDAGAILYAESIVDAVNAYED